MIFSTYVDMLIKYLSSIRMRSGRLSPPVPIVLMWAFEEEKMLQTTISSLILYYYSLQLILSLQFSALSPYFNSFSTRFYLMNSPEGVWSVAAKCLVMQIKQNKKKQPTL